MGLEICPVFLFPNWERVVVGNLSDKVGPNWELGPNYAAAANSVGIGWESGSPKNSVGAPKIAKTRFSLSYRDHRCAYDRGNPRSELATLTPPGIEPASKSF